jgi:hypothetical protein
VPIGFVVPETGGDERAPIILGQPFMSTAKVIIYADTTKICFAIKDKNEKFSFKDRILYSPAYPHKAYNRSDQEEEEQEKEEEQDQPVT